MMISNQPISRLRNFMRSYDKILKRSCSPTAVTPFYLKVILVPGLSVNEISSPYTDILSTALDTFEGHRPSNTNRAHARPTGTTLLQRPIHSHCVPRLHRAGPSHLKPKLAGVTSTSKAVLLNISCCFVSQMINPNQDEQGYLFVD